MLKAKEREVERLSKELSEKGDVIKNYACQVEELKKDMKNKCKKFREIVKQLKSANCNKVHECNTEDPNDCDNAELEDLLRSLVLDVEVQRKSLICQFQTAECQLKAMASEKKKYLKERNEIDNQLERLRAENERLKKEIACQVNADSEKQELLHSVDQLKTEKKELSERINCLLENIQELSNNFKETRWALTTEVAEKHDQVQELRRCVGVLEEQLRQADMQTHFKDDIIKELRKELKASQKTISSLDSSENLPSHEYCPPTQMNSLKSFTSPDKNAKDDDLKLDIHIFPVKDSKGDKPDRRRSEKALTCHSVEVQTEPCQSPSAKMRNVSTQHKFRVQKLPRSFGTLTVTPWSGTSGDVASETLSFQELKETKKNLRGIYTVPYGQN